ncbi:MAG: hypothetical protein WAO58_13525 [Fimbriimonadaceae bacterium]
MPHLTRSRLLLCVLALLAASLGVTQQKWDRYSFKAAKISVRLPVPPTQKTESISEMGFSTNLRGLLAQDGVDVYMAATMRLPFIATKETEKLLFPAMREGMAKDAGMTLTRFKNARFSGMDGQLCDFAGPGGIGSGRVWFALRRDRLYMLMQMGMGDGFPDVRKFFNSLRRLR